MKHPKTFAKVLKHDTVYRSLRDGLNGIAKMEDVKPADGKKFSLKELQGFVSGYIEIVPSIFPDLLIVCNEEAKLVREWEVTVNILATVLYKHAEHDVIAGNVLLVHKSLIN